MKRIALNKDLHPESLERLCTAALVLGDAETAFMYADRRCRIMPLAGSHHFALRAEARMRLGDRDGAMSDINTALELSPEDIQANRRMLTWGDADQKAAAAQALVATDDDAAVLVQALGVLCSAGRKAVAAAHISDETIAGWVVWDGPVEPVLTVTDDRAEQPVDLIADPTHPLADCVFANVAGFHLRRSMSPSGHTVALALSGKEFFRARAPANTAMTLREVDGELPEVGHSSDITVIIPIYRDYAATRACLDTVEPEISGKTGRHAILINDATPEPKLKRYLRSFSGKPGFTVLTNDRNLGFVASVNRALMQVSDGDVVLLNADTIIPSGCFERMASVTRSDPTVGTVTPFSNNGEFTSFPVAFEQNPLPSRATLAETDRIAASVNRDRLVDLPNGIGFCLFVTRRCLDSVGLLSQDYQRGYLEDVDFCLRARQLGFRNVCAPSIYVGHHGSRSFGGDKRALVVRNIAIAEQRFPDYRSECALFMAADPLRPARAAIERKLTCSRRYDRLLVCGEGLLDAVTEERALGLRRRRKKALLMQIARSGSGAVLRLRDAEGAAPQSLTFRIDRPGLRDLRDYLSSVRFEVVEIVEPGVVSDELYSAIEGFGKPIDVLAADAGLLCPRGTLLQPDGRVCETLGTGMICEGCASHRNDKPGDRRRWRDRWTSIDTSRVVAPCDMAEGFKTFVAARESLPIAHCDARQMTGPSVGAAGRMGLVVQGSSVDEFRLIQQFLRAAVRRSPRQVYLVVGKTADDLALMAIGNAFVTGAVEAADGAAVLRQYGIERVFLPLRRPLYGHPLATAARQSGSPTAYFDWSFGKGKRREMDLAIDPRCSVDDLVHLIGRWMGS